MEYHIKKVWQMDIRSLRYFLVTAQEKNITKAAEKLFIAQPPLSRQIKLLEEELGVTLFIRGKRQLQLTEEGYYLKQQAEKIIYLLNKTESRLGSMTNSEYGTISLGATETCCVSILSDLIGQFHKLYPHIRFQLWAGDSDELQERLKNNLVDIGIIRNPPKTESYDRIFLHSEPWIAVCSEKNPLSEQEGDGIELSALKNESMIIPSRQSVRNEINSWLSGAITERNIFCLYNSINSVIGLAERNLGVIICPESVRNFVAAENLCCKKIIPARESKVYIVKKSYQVMNTALERFWDFSLNYQYLPNKKPIP